MVPREFRKSFCVVAGLFTLLEAVLWGAASIFAIGAYNCAWDFIYVTRGVSVRSMLRITYFMGGCSGSDAASRLGYSFLPPSGAASGLQVWLWANAILSAIWIATSFLLIVVASSEVSGKNGAVMYYPWQAFTGVLIIYDLAGSLYYFIDVFQTLTADNYAEFTSSTSWDILTLQSASEGIITWLPSLIVTLFFCRLIIIWILNIVFLSGVYRASRAVSSYKVKNLQSRPIPESPERIRSWRDMFQQGIEPITSHHQPQARPNLHTSKQELPQTVRDVHEPEVLAPRSPYQLRRNVGYLGRPLTPDFTKEHWQDIPPPMSGEIKVPPELSRVRPFSYTAGDQPQRVKTNISRSNSRAEYPSIPRPDYTIAERRAASLEYIPNRFKVPSPKRQTLRSPSPLAPAFPKKPQNYPRTLTPTVEVGIIPQAKFSPQVPNTRHNDYNINNLY